MTDYHPRHLTAWTLLVLFTCGGARHEASAVEITAVRLGFSGFAKVGHWTPITVTLQGDRQPQAGRLVIGVPDGEDVPCRYEREGAPIEVPAGESVEVRRYIRLGRPSRTMAVAFHPDDRSSAAVSVDWPIDLQQTIRHSQQCVLVLGPPVGLEIALRFRSRSPGEETRSAHVTDAAALPDHWFGYDGIDLLILSTGRPEFCQQVSAGQWDALEQWVAFGGRLVMAVGSQAETLLAEGQPLRRFLPGPFEATVLQRETNDLESYAKSTQRLDLTWRQLPQGQRGIPTARLRKPRGLEAAAEGAGRRRIAWITRTAFGLGTVNFVACDLDTGPVADWAGRPRLLARLLDDNLAGSSDEADRSDAGQVTHLGFTDLAGQLRAALDQFEGVRLVPFSLIAALATAYILLIGPGDYFLLKKLSPRMEWTWLTFPLTILLLSVLAVVMARSWKAASPRQNVVDLLDVDPQRGTLRCSTWSHVYCPRADRYDLSLSVEPPWRPPQGRLLAWQGLPGTGFGGMENQAVTSLRAEPYGIVSRFAQTPAGEPRGEVESRVVALPVPTWSSRSLSGVWWLRGEPEVAAELNVRDNVLTGSIRNPLPVEVRDAVICYGRWYFEVGNLAPGAVFTLGERVRPRDARSRWTRRRIVSDKEIINPWEKESFDVPRIMEMITFHELAGGRAYTDLLNRYHNELDLSDHLQTGTAVLFGRLARPVTQWQCAQLEIDLSHSRTWSFCRILYPLQGSTEITP